MYSMFNNEKTLLQFTEEKYKGKRMYVYNVQYIVKKIKCSFSILCMQRTRGSSSTLYMQILSWLTIGYYWTTCTIPFFSFELFWSKECFSCVFFIKKNLLRKIKIFLNALYGWMHGWYMYCLITFSKLTLYSLYLKVLSSSVGDPDPDDPHVFFPGLPDPDPLDKGKDPDPAPDPSLFS